MSENLNAIRQDAFFAVVNGEIFVWDELEAALKRHSCKVSAGRFIPLHFLCERSMRLCELAACAHTKASAMSRLVERMIADGLVEKAPDDDDRRAVALHITEEGRRVEAEARVVFDECLACLFGPLSAEELGTLLSLMGRLGGAGKRQR